MIWMFLWILSIFIQKVDPNVQTKPLGLWVVTMAIGQLQLEQPPVYMDDNLLLTGMPTLPCDFFRGALWPLISKTSFLSRRSFHPIHKWMGTFDMIFHTLSLDHWNSKNPKMGIWQPASIPVVIGNRNVPPATPGTLPERSERCGDPRAALWEYWWWPFCRGKDTMGTRLMGRNEGGIFWRRFFDQNQQAWDCCSWPMRLLGA